MPHTVTEAIEAFAPRRDRRRHRRRRPRERGRPHRRGLALHAGEDGLHHPPHLRHRLRAADAPTRRAACGSIRWWPSNDAPLGTAFTVSVDVRHGLTTGISAEQRTQHRARARQPQHGRGRFRAARPRLSADRQGRRRAHALRPYRGGGRPLPARRPAAGRRDLRARQRRRHGDEGRRRSRPSPSEHGLQAHLGRRPHRLPAGAREARRADRHLSGQDRVGRAHGLRLCDALRSACSISPSSTGASATGATCSCACTAPTSSPTSSRAARPSPPSCGASPRRAAACSSICATAPPACR